MYTDLFYQVYVHPNVYVCSFTFLFGMFEWLGVFGADIKRS